MMTREPARAFLPAAILAALCSAAAGQDRTEPSPDDPGFPAYVMKKVDDLHRGEKSHGTTEMKIKTANWTRTLSLESWSLGEDYSLVRILSPKKEKGTATLKAGKDLFTYLSKTGKTIKISSAMMGGSWMGSHFTNDDLVRNSRLSEDFTIKLILNGPDDSGTPVYRFRCVPHPDAPVVWGKIVVTVRQGDLQPLREGFYDEDGKKVRELVFSDHKEVEGRTLPMQMKIRPLDGSGEYTKMTIKAITFDVKLSKDFFSIQKLKSL